MVCKRSGLVNISRHYWVAMDLCRVGPCLNMDLTNDVLNDLTKDVVHKLSLEVEVILNIEVK